MSDLLFKGLMLSIAQAEVPDDATRFETETIAADAAHRFLRVTKTWRIEEWMMAGGEKMFVVKHWPRHKMELCAERRWMKLNNTKKRRKK